MVQATKQDRLGDSTVIYTAIYVVYSWLLFSFPFDAVFLNKSIYFCSLIILYEVINALFFFLRSSYSLLIYCYFTIFNNFPVLHHRLVVNAIETSNHLKLGSGKMHKTLRVKFGCTHMSTAFITWIQQTADACCFPTPNCILQRLRWK